MIAITSMMSRNAINGLRSGGNFHKLTHLVPKPSYFSSFATKGSKEPFFNGKAALLTRGVVGMGFLASFFKDEIRGDEIRKDEIRKKSLSHSLNFQDKPGRHTLQSPVIGSRAEELLAVKEAIKSESTLSKLEKAICKNNFFYFIPTIKKDEADEVARGLFLDYISKYSSHGCTEQNIVNWIYDDNPRFYREVWINDLENEWNTWFAQAAVEGRHGSHNEIYNRYLPPHIMAYNAVMRLEEIQPKVKEFTQARSGLLTSIEEVSIKTIITLGTVYEKINEKVFGKDRKFTQEENGSWVPTTVKVAMFFDRVRRIYEMVSGKDSEFIQEENGSSLLKNIKTIILLDTVYKKIYEIDEASEVDYGKFIDINNTKIKLGRFANFYREKESEMEKLYLALLSPESMEFLKGEIQ